MSFGFTSRDHEYHAQAREYAGLSVPPLDCSILPGGTLNATRRWAWGFVLPTLCPVAAHACAVCYGAEGDPQTAGMNGAIFTLLGFVAVVGAGVGGLAFRMMRRARLAASLGEVLSRSHVVSASSPADDGERTNPEAYYAGLEAATHVNDLSPADDGERTNPEAYYAGLEAATHVNDLSPADDGERVDLDAYCAGLDAATPIGLDAATPVRIADVAEAAGVER